MLRTLANFMFKRYDGSAAPLDQGTDTMASGSSNVMISGTGKNFIFRGIKILDGGTPVGSKVMMNAATDYAGLGDYNETGIGSVFRVLGAIFFIGAGRVYYNGTYQSVSATTTLQIKKMVSGSLGTTYQAGSAQPSAPTILAVTPPAGFTGKNNGTVSARITRVRAATGGESNVSLSSNAVTATNQSIAITFPSADANGQDYWGVYVTKNAEGAIGNAYFLQEVPESVIAATVTASRVATNTTSIGVANGTLTSTHIGWQYTSSGDVTTYVTAVGADDSYAAGKQAITLNAANGSTNTQNATFTRAVSGVTRTYVFEWRDSDLVGADIAPIRNYPPPAAIFGGSIGDVTFVDGALGDTVDVTRYARDNSISSANTTTTTVGNAIAVSDPAKPESFPPDNYIFTNDAPTAVLQGGDGVVWRFARNSLGVIRYVGGSPALSYEKIWTGIGIENQNHCVLGAGGRLYAYTGQRGLVRLGVNGEPDTLWAAPIHDDMSGFTSSNVSLGYDANQQYVLVMHGTTILAFYEPLEVWCSPLSISSSVSVGAVAVSAVTYQGNVYLSVGDGTASASVYNFNDAPTGLTVTGTVRTPWVVSQGVTDVLSRIHVASRTAFGASTSLTVKTYVNGSSSASSNQSQSLSTSGTGHIIHATPLRPNVRSAKSWRVEASFDVEPSGNEGFDLIRVEGETSGIDQ